MKKLRNIYRLLKRIIKGFMGKDILIFPDCKDVKYKLLGSDYGGWPVVDSIFKSNPVVYLFGVGEDITYDLSIINKYSIDVNAFDPTPRSCEWVKQQVIPREFHFYNYGLSDIDGVEQFIPPEKDTYMSFSSVKVGEGISLRVNKLSTILSELNHKAVDVLKMDIEGGEYKVINNILHENITPKILLIEFHHRFPEVGLNKTINSINLLKSRGYCVFYVSPNGEEYGFFLKE